MDHEREAFERAISDNKYDEVARRIFADWLSEHGFDDEADLQYSWTPEKQRSEDFITAFAKDCDFTYEEMMAAINKYLDTGHQLGLPMNIPEQDPNLDELWKHVEVLTGKKIGGRQKGFYFCDCGPWMESEDNDSFANPR